MVIIFKISCEVTKFKLRPFEILASYNGIIWALQMENGSGALKAVPFLHYYTHNFMQLKDVTTGKAQPVEFSTCGILAKTKQW